MGRLLGDEKTPLYEKISLLSARQDRIYQSLKCRNTTTGRRAATRRQSGREDLRYYERLRHTLRTVVMYNGGPGDYGLPRLALQREGAGGDGESAGAKHGADLSDGDLHYVGAPIWLW